MIVPLYATVVNNGKALEIWADKQKHVVDLPFKPYFYSKTPRQDVPAEQTKEIVRYISDFNERLVTKYSFESVKDIPLYRNDDSMESDIPYVQRVCIDEPQYFTQFSQTKSLDILHFDIETLTTGKFPKPETNKIIGIGYALNQEKPTVLTIKTLEESDSEILARFSDAIDELDPDVLCTYFGNTFDIPYIIDRMNLCGWSSKAFTRDPEADECYFLDDQKEKHVYIKGRVLFDIYDEVQIDQTLSGIQNRQMKTVAKWYNLQSAIRQRQGFQDYEIITEDLSNTAQLVGTTKLYDYLMSDVLITQELSKIYLPNVIQLASLMKVPLNTITRRSASLIGTIFYARELKATNTISDAPNYVLHPEVFGKPVMTKKRGRTVTEFAGGTGYQGATVSINPSHTKKRIKPLKKIDFSGMYPSIMVNFNLSPETVTLKKLKPFIEPTFSINYTDDKQYELEFSDARIQKNVVITVLRKEGFVPKNLKTFMTERAKIKKELKNCTDTDKKIELNSKSWVYKVLGNATGYGVNGTGFFRYGNLWAAVATTAIGRYLISLVRKELGEDLIEEDTDGSFHKKMSISAEELTAHINNTLQKQLGITTNFEIEQEEYKAGIFLRMKNYALLDDKDRLIKHGVSMKASSKNLLLQEALNKILVAILKNMDVEKTCFEALDKLDQAQLHEYLQSTKISMELENYASQPSAGKRGCLQVQVGRQSESYHEQKIRTGDQVSYAKTVTGRYRIRETLKDTTMIDKIYYRKQILKTIERLNLHDIKWKMENRGQKLLDDFGFFLPKAKITTSSVYSQAF